MRGSAHPLPQHSLHRELCPVPWCVPGSRSRGQTSSVSLAMSSCNQTAGMTNIVLVNKSIAINGLQTFTFVGVWNDLQPVIFCKAHVTASLSRKLLCSKWWWERRFSIRPTKLSLWWAIMLNLPTSPLQAGKCSTKELCKRWRPLQLSVQWL